MDNRPGTDPEAPGRGAALQLQPQRKASQSITGRLSASNALVQMKGAYENFQITTKQGVLEWIEEGEWDPNELLAVVRDWNSEHPQERVTFADLAAIDYESFFDDNDPMFAAPPETDSDSEDEDDVAPAPNAVNIPEPKMYQVVREGWQDETAMVKHCYTYCQGDRLVLVRAAENLGLAPPMLGHGSAPGSGGTNKDAALWKEFQTYMEWYFADRGHEGRTTNAIAKKINRENT